MGLCAGKTAYPRPRWHRESAFEWHEKTAQNIVDNISDGKWQFCVTFAKRLLPSPKTPRSSLIYLQPLNLQSSHSARNNRRARSKNGNNWQYYEPLQASVH